MGMSRIEQLIDEIIEFIDGCKTSALSSSKVVVPKDTLYDLLDELKLRTPDEIKRYQKIIANRDSIIADAEARAQQIMQDAQARAEQLINEHDITQQAYAQANEMVSTASEQASRMLNSANSESEQIRAGAVNYTNDMLAAVENILTGTYNSIGERAEQMMNALQANIEIVTQNRKELCDQMQTPPAAKGTQTSQSASSQASAQKTGTPQKEEPQESEEEDFGDFNDFDDDTFLKDID